ncbi:MAG: translation initiation factor IF-2 N-terminal domain-containing protein, partial [Planctomycetota bacterium]
MSTKKRIHELAKEYGMTGQELVTKLKALGVSDVKSASSTLDDFQLLMVEGTLAANGILKASAAPKADAPAAEAGESIGG